MASDGSDAARSADARRAIDRAFAHWQAGDLDRALVACHDALAFDPESVDALSNAATIVWMQGDPAEAERLYRRAHALAPNHVGVLVNLATLRQESGDADGARACLDRARALRPTDRELIWRQSLLELADGDYRAGWAHYEAGLGIAAARGAGPGFPTPSWDGGPCDRLLLWHEQGLGDTIQFVRYARLCRSRARRVVVLCPTELTAFVRSCPFVDDAVDSIGADDFDRHVSLMSLPARFGTTVDTIPDDVPYLFADPARGAALDALLPARSATSVPGERLRVGLVWAGNVRAGQLRFRSIDRARSVPFAAFRPLLDVDGVDFFALQLGPAAVEADADFARGRCVDLMNGVRDYADTAARIDRLDLVISVDTSVVHAAGALGRPVWVLSRVDACWRWLGNRSDNPWYPTATVFGQTARGRWDDVVDRVRDALASVARQGPSALAMRR